MNTDLPPIPCPVCESCEHDLRGGLLELIENIVQNLKDAGETLLDAIEAEGAAPEKFLTATHDFMSVRRQVAAVIDVVPDIAEIKRVAHS